MKDVTGFLLFLLMIWCWAWGAGAVVTTVITAPDIPFGGYVGIIIAGLILCRIGYWLNDKLKKWD